MGGGGCGGFAAGDTNDAEDGDFAKGGARNEDAVGIGVEIGRGDLDAVVEKREKVIGDYAFERVAIQEAQAEPEAVELGTAEEGFALRFVIAFEVADEVDGPDFGEGQLLMFAIGSEQVERVELAEAAGVEVAAQGLAVKKSDDDLLVGRGWGAEFQESGRAPWLEMELPIMISISRFAQDGGCMLC